MQSSSLPETCLVEDEQVKSEVTEYLLKMRNVLDNSLSNVEIIRTKRKQIVEDVENDKSIKFNLEKDIGELETDLKIKTLKRHATGNQILSMRNEVKELADELVSCQEILNTIEETGKSVSQHLFEQNKKSTDSSKQYASCLRDLERQIMELNHAELNHRKENANKILNLDNEYTNLTEKEENCKKQFNFDSNLLNEYTEKNNLLLKEISQSEILCLDVKKKLQEKEAELNDLTYKIENDKAQFQVAVQEASNNALDIENRILKKKTTIDTLEKTLHDKRNYKEKIRQKLNANTCSLSNLKEAVTCKSTDIDVLKSKLKVKEEDVRKLEEKFATEDNITEIEINNAILKNTNDELLNAVKKIELEIENFRKNEHDNFTKTEILEQQYLVASSLRKDLTLESNSLNLSFAIWEKEAILVKHEKTIELSKRVSQLEKIAYQEKQLKKSNTQELNTLKLESDVKILEQKAVLDEQLKLLVNEEESMEFEITKIENATKLKSAELDQITRKCICLKEAIKTKNKAEKAAAENRKVPTSASDIQFIVPKRPLYLDELSGSSAESGRLLTMEEVQKMKNRKIKRQLRQERKQRTNEINSGNIDKKL